MPWIFALFLVSSIFLPGAGHAQTAAERAACKADFMKLCHGVLPGGNRPFKCLSKHQDKLSPACLKVIKAHTK